VATGLYFLIDCSMVADCAKCCSQNLDELYITLVENTKLNLVEICQLIYELTGARTLGLTVCPGNLPNGKMFHLEDCASSQTMMHRVQSGLYG